MSCKNPIKHITIIKENLIFPKAYLSKCHHFSFILCTLRIRVFPFTTCRLPMCAYIPVHFFLKEEEKYIKSVSASKRIFFDDVNSPPRRSPSAPLNTIEFLFSLFVSGPSEQKMNE